eukprot:CAMPEP_0183543100 /NCGR_PEP_ID=MMETSP0371-20130417/43293_1 /TAXON_ID=268820 /ORGANISM="Peridinium aciculiferum, Strain PAER-2" /LENGTH=96 /DNA_ID=CAMNT_0025744493 /DNA_START=336 /DNA_END=626 /DNA_ORIENTATION=-
MRVSTPMCSVSAMVRLASLSLSAPFRRDCDTAEERLRSSLDRKSLSVLPEFPASGSSNARRAFWSSCAVFLNSPRNLSSSLAILARSSAGAAFASS